jgi:hypothetical protein
MDLKQRNVLVDRIAAGIIYHTYNGQVYKLVPSNNDQRALAAMVYYNIINEIKFDALVTREQSRAFLHHRGIWTPRHDIQIEQLEKRVEDLKLGLYKAALYKEKEQKSIRRNLKNIRSAIDRLLHQKYSLDNMTKEYHAENIKDELLTALCIQTFDGTPVYTHETFWDNDIDILQSFLYYMPSLLLSSQQYRELARRDPFRSLWTIGQGRVFGDLAPIDLTFEQKNMILYAKMYDNVYEHPDRPTDKIINDDDMLDGWFIKQQRDAEKDRKQKEVEALLGTKGRAHSDADETFVMAGSSDEAANVRGLNDLNAQMAVKQRDQAIQRGGKLRDQDLPDIKLELRNRAMKQMAEQVKGKK